jgi:hypothetical protein
LRRLHGISIYIANRERMGDIYVVTARAKDRTGREDESPGAVPLGNLKGDALANALMKAETKAKRRVTLSIAGLGWLDETELATIPGVHTDAPDAAHEMTGISHPLPVGEDGTPGAATPSHPTAEDITTLVNSARAANVDLEAFGHDMRRLMQLSNGQKITKKFREYCLRNHIECENLSHVPIDPKPCKQRHREIHHLLRTRDDNRSAFEAAKPMPLSAMVPLDAIRVGFAHDQSLRGKHRGIHLPMIGAVERRSIYRCL